MIYYYSNPHSQIAKNSLYGHVGQVLGSAERHLVFHEEGKKHSNEITSLKVSCFLRWLPQLPAKTCLCRFSQAACWIVWPNAGSKIFDLLQCPHCRRMHIISSNLTGALVWKRFGFYYFHSSSLTHAMWRRGGNDIFPQLDSVFCMKKWAVTANAAFEIGTKTNGNKSCNVCLEEKS